MEFLLLHSADASAHLHRCHHYLQSKNEFYSWQAGNDHEIVLSNSFAYDVSYEKHRNHAQFG